MEKGAVKKWSSFLHSPFWDDENVSNSGKAAAAALGKH